MKYFLMGSKGTENFTKERRSLIVFNNFFIFSGGLGGGRPLPRGRTVPNLNISSLFTLLVTLNDGVSVTAPKEGP
jgi:hypothetical protein